MPTSAAAAARISGTPWWPRAPVRARLVAELRARAGEFELRTLPGGFGENLVLHGLTELEV